MESSQHTYTSIDELRHIQFEARNSSSLDELRHYYDRVQGLRRAHADDFELQLLVADIQEQIIERARRLREEPTPVPVDDSLTPRLTRRRAVAQHTDEHAETPPEAHRVDAKTWRLATYLALFFTLFALAFFFYLVQAARKANFPSASNGYAAQQNQPGRNGNNTPVQNTANTPVPAPTKPTLRLYTDLVPGTVSLDGKQTEDLKDGELVLDNLPPGEHSVKVTGPNGEAAFSFDVSEKSAPRVVGLPTASNAMAVLVATQDGAGRLLTNADQSEVLVDGKTAGQATSDGLTIDKLGTADHELQVTQGRDRQRFVLTYTAAPALTAFVKSDPNAGTLVVTTGQDGVQIYLNEKLYRRKTDRGQLRIPNLRVGEYTIRVHKQGFIDPPPATVEIKKAEETPVQFNLQPVPQIATLQIKGTLPGTMVYVDNDFAAATSANGGADISNIKPGEHTIELRRDQAFAKKFQRTFHTGDVIELSGPDVTLEKTVGESTPPVAAPSEPAADANPAENNAMEIEGKQVRKGGGFVPYHVPKIAGHYTFTAEAHKGGFLHHGKLEWYAGYEDDENYILFTLDGKHASIREVRNGKSTEISRIPFNSGSNEWVTVDLSVKPASVEARVKSEDGVWTDLGTVSSPGRDFTKGKVGFHIPGNDEIAVSNFRFSPR